MGKPTGFMEFKREIPVDREPLERIKDWNEFHEHMSTEDRQSQGARCMDCGTPFCHTGMLLSGMASGCPINNLIPEWNDLVYKGLWQDALERLLKTNNFPEFTGRVCPAPCEGSCVLGLIEPPVTIKNNECSIIDRAFEENRMVPAPPKNRTGKKVAVVGSGPAGLSCAAQLNKAGHSVTVFERADRVGGLLMYGIPNMKLDKKEVVLRRIKLMEAEGVEFKTSVDVGKDFPAENLLKDFDAAVLCCGSTKPRDLAIDGRSLNGVHFAMEYLTASTKALLDGTEPEISAEGKNVIVIGGGDTGTDCVGTALRQKCKSVVQLEIMPKPPLERANDNPWPEWPKVYKMDYGQEEAAAVQGEDPRQYCTMTSKFLGDDNGNVKEAHTVQGEWITFEDGRKTLKVIPGTEKIYEVDLVLLAMGFIGPEDVLLESLGVERDGRTNAKAEYGKFATSVPGVFAAGDMRRGQSLVVWAINEGRAAARECDRYLMGETVLP
ncbi:glutamate synthase, NADH/NADPH, small subunit [Chloroherpeton thalassium ATCC 35110]|uniref:Glutamate synthase, NADH/NADPH, small subunit n=1 Tax=Chloroherpeton thalassium (strain ATCC 35110 / GB-78) TaxID=517418 RepID=B3QVL8_CHLT3|nr:glutamate synthase subunit beta [Chloroherpeton thalassium]ACF14618.1 glutamate synthase, NADH/NADPH, small subunit [Chloroherpeton thalassium ATCC 35110]